ncbi:MAG: GNAT family N-acetyltransferase [Spirochaetaceae bacterium]|nr:GNAT family N-acetyltransferase [Spirochaetaceae bacterium]
MDLQIRKAVPEDAEILIKIYNAAFYEDFVRYGVCPAYGRSVNEMQKSIIEIPKYIAFHDSIPVGVISVKDKGEQVYYIGCLCVIPEFQRKGIGHQLIEFIKTQYSDWKKIELITPVDKEKNVKFYTQKCGFVIDREEMDKSVKVYHFSIQCL